MAKRFKFNIAEGCRLSECLRAEYCISVPIDRFNFVLNIHCIVISSY